MRLVRDGSLECLPVYSKGSMMGEEPTVIFNFRSVRRRAPLVHTLSSRTRKNNLATLHIGAWISTYVPVGPKSPLQEVVERRDKAELHNHYIIFKNGKAFVKIFQMVKDWSGALRQTDHIFARYEVELEELYSELFRLEDELRKVQVDSSAQKDLLQLRVEIAAIHLRIAQIQQIGSDRSARDFALQFVIAESFKRLGQYAQTLYRMANQYNRAQGFGRLPLITYLQALDRDLDFFSSKEILAYRSVARRNIRLITADSSFALSGSEIVTYLVRAKRALENAQRRLAEWSATLSEEESRQSALLRQRFVLTKQL